MSAVDKTYRMWLWPRNMSNVKSKSEWVVMSCMSFICFMRSATLLFSDLFIDVGLVCFGLSVFKWDLSLKSWLNIWTWACVNHANRKAFDLQIDTTTYKHEQTKEWKENTTDTRHTNIYNGHACFFLDSLTHICCCQLCTELACVRFFLSLFKLFGDIHVRCCWNHSKNK